jgi:hypothetical protein
MVNRAEILTETLTEIQIKSIQQQLREEEAGMVGKVTVR